MIVNRQNKVRLEWRGLRTFLTRLRKELRLGRVEFNICLVSDKEIARLNSKFRGKRRPTDVLSFSWSDGTSDSQGQGLRAARPGARAGRGKEIAALRKVVGSAEFANFLGDIVISAETARRNARAEGHPLAREIRWLILHGVLHLLGYDHDADSGEMNTLELSLRERLRI